MTSNNSRRTLPLAGLWIASGIAVLAAHAGIAVALATWPLLPDEPSGAAPAILVNLAPVSAISAAEQENLPVAPPENVTPEPEEKQEARKEEPVPEAKIEEPTPPEPPPPTKAEVVLPPEPRPVKKPPPKAVRMATAAERAEKIAPRQRALTAGVASINPNSMRTYATSIIRPHILRFYNFPERAKAKGESGSVIVNFSITRTGRLIARHIAKSSGHPDLDSEALATLQRAQPYPPPPPELTDQQFTFSLPMNYNIR